MNLLDYYAQPGPITHAGALAVHFDDLPNNLPELVKTLQGLMVHIFWTKAYGLDLSDERNTEVTLRQVKKQLTRMLDLDPAPFTRARPPERKLVGNCRDFSVMLTAILRHQGIPARARCGFGTYFIPNHYEDHWVCEYWNAGEKRWVLVDAQLDELMIEKMGIKFDPLDTPRDQFIAGGHAWQLCRSGTADPKDFGIFDMSGLWFVRGNLLRDFLSFNKMEILPWDGGWGYLEKQDTEATEEDIACETMDHIADLMLAGDGSFEEIRTLYETDARFPPPPAMMGLE